MEVQAVSFQKSKRMSVVQLLTARHNSFDYISGATAIKNELVRVNEVSEAGRVNDLFVFNLSDKYVFFMDGDILMGAKQNRVLNTSVLLAPNSKSTLPVSCVEQGRWSKISDSFIFTDNISPQKIRALKSEAVKANLRSNNTYASDQMQVWDEVGKYQAAFSVNSPTMNLNELYDREGGNFESYIKDFTPDENANGVAVFSDKELINLDVFNRTNIYREYFSKILKSSAIEVSQLKDSIHELTEAEAISKTVLLFDTVGKAPFSEHPGVGAGNEKRYDNDEFTGFELGCDNAMIHLTVLSIENGKNRKHGDYRKFGNH